MTLPKHILLIPEFQTYYILLTTGCKVLNSVALFFYCWPIVFKLRYFAIWCCQHVMQVTPYPSVTCLIKGVIVHVMLRDGSRNDTSLHKGANLVHIPCRKEQARCYFLCWGWRLRNVIMMAIAHSQMHWQVGPAKRLFAVLWCLNINSYVLHKQLWKQDRVMSHSSWQLHYIVCIYFHVVSS